MHSTPLPVSSLPLRSHELTGRERWGVALDEFFALLDELALPTETTAIGEVIETEPAVAEEDESPAEAPAPASAVREDSTVSLKGRRFAILATDGFEESELEEPRRALRKAGAQTEVVSFKIGRIRGWADNRFRAHHGQLHARSGAGRGLRRSSSRGGVTNPAKLRTEPKAVAFARAFFDVGKPVAAICHAPPLLIEADVVRGRRMTSYPSVRVDLINAGAHWVDAAVVVDRGLVTSRSPADLNAFNEKMLEEFAEGPHPKV